MQQQSLGLCDEHLAWHCSAAGVMPAVSCRQEQSGSLLDILSPTATPRNTQQPDASGGMRWQPAWLTKADDEARLQQLLERQQWAAARDVAASMGKSLDTILK